MDKSRASLIRETWEKTRAVADFSKGPRWTVALLPPMPLSIHEETSTRCERGETLDFVLERGRGTYGAPVERVVCEGIEVEFRQA